MSSNVQLYSFPTPNGQKIGILLEELGIPYDVHVINITKGDQHTEDFLKINPNGKIPAIVDPEGPDGKPLSVFESGAILIYLAEKTGKFIPADPAKRIKVLEWLFWQVGGAGPMFGQFNHFNMYAPEKIEYGINRYLTETRRLLDVLDKQLSVNQYVAGDEYTIADISLIGWIKYMTGVETVKGEDFPNVKSWLERCLARPAVQKGLLVAKP